MRVLVVAGGVPYPPTWGSGMRTFQLLRHAARHHEVTFVCPVSDYDRDRLSGLFDEIPGMTVRAVHRDLTSFRRRRIDQLRAVFGMTPYLVAEARSQRLQACLDSELAARGEFDLVQLEGSQLAALRIPPGLPLVVNEHNVEYEVLRRMRESERSRSRRVFNSMEYLKYRTFEHRLWNRADACAVPSDRELSIVREVAPRTPATTVQNAVDPDYFAPGPPAVRPGSIVFTGLLSYRPNFDAALHLVDAIFPLVRRLRPEVSLTIVGDGDLSHFDALRREGVTVTGRVEDLRPHVRAASVCVAPIRMGGGTRLKVLEALSMGKAVVSTPLGSEGIAARHGEHLILADHAPEEFASAIIRLLDDPDTASMLGARGRRLVEQHYTWEQAWTRLDELYRVAVRGNRPRTPAATSY